MNNHSPLVSIIIPVYNCRRHLGEAIKSALAQTYRPIEIIIVDDGSTDGSAEVAKSFVPAVRYLHQSNSGAGSARNHGAATAQGSLIAFLDADDLWVENKLAIQTAEFERDPNLDMAFGMIGQFYSPELSESFRSRIHCPTELMPGYFPGTMLVKKDAFLRVGPFETNWKIGEFISWYLRAVEMGLRTAMLPDLVTRRRLHEANMGIRERHSVNDYARILKASLDRRRAISENMKAEPRERPQSM